MRKTVLIILIIMIVIGLGFTGYFILNNHEQAGNNTSNNGKTNYAFFDKNNLKEDTYLTYDYNNDILYESKIYVPKNLTKLSSSNDWPEYEFSNDNYSLRLSYHNYLEESNLKTFKIDMEFEKEDYYYISKSECSAYIYFENNVGLFQTITITMVDRESGKCNLTDNSYKNIMKNLNTTEINKDDYYLRPVDGYYIGSISYIHYLSEDKHYSAELSYKVDASKYGSNYNDAIISPSLYLDNTSISFYEGEITLDISSVQKQTRISMYVSYIKDLNLQDAAKKEIEWALNQPAFNNVQEKDVDIDYGSLDYDNKKVEYFKIVSNKNNSHNERITAYLQLKDNNYYVISIYGGLGKKLDLDMIKEFLPTKITEK